MPINYRTRRYVSSGRVRCPGRYELPRQRITGTRVAALARSRILGLALRRNVLPARRTTRPQASYEVEESITGFETANGPGPIDRCGQEGEAPTCRR